MLLNYNIYLLLNVICGNIYLLGEHYAEKK